MTQTELAASWAGLVERLLPPVPRCDYSDLPANTCAHCLGHVAETDAFEAAARKKVIYG